MVVGGRGGNGVVGPRNSPNVARGGKRPQLRPGAKKNWGEVELFLLGWNSRAQEYKPDPGK